MVHSSIYGGELPTPEPKVSRDREITPQDIAKADPYGEHDPNNVAEALREEAEQRATFEARQAYVAAFENTKQQWLDGFVGRTDSLGIRIEGLEKLTLDPDTLSFIHRNDYVGPDENTFSCIVGVVAREHKYYGPEVIRQGQINIHDGEIYEHESFWTLPGSLGNEPQSDVIASVAENKFTELKLRIYAPHPENAGSADADVVKFNILYDSKGGLLAITSFAFAPKQPDRDRAYSKYTDAVFRHDSGKFPKLKSETEKELATLFNVPEFQIPERIDIAETFSRTAEGYLAKKKEPVLVAADMPKVEAGN